MTPKIEFGMAQTYFCDRKTDCSRQPDVELQSIAKGYTPPPAVSGKVNIPTWKSELYFEYHRGVMTTQANHKRNMREAEEQVLERGEVGVVGLAGWQELSGGGDHRRLEEGALQPVPRSGGGSGIGVIYKDAQKDYDVVRWSTNEIDAGALGTVAERIDTTGAKKRLQGTPVVVFNPLAWTRDGAVTVKIPIPASARSVTACDDTMMTDSYPAPCLSTHIVARDREQGTAEVSVETWEVPAFGFRTIHLSPDARPEQSRASAAREDGKGGLVLGGAWTSLTVNKATGCITSLIEQRGSNFDLIAPGGCGNQLQLFKDTPKDYDAWNIDPGTLDQSPAPIAQADSVEPVIDADWKRRNSSEEDLAEF